MSLASDNNERHWLDCFNDTNGTYVNIRHGSSFDPSIDQNVVHLIDLFNSKTAEHKMNHLERLSETTSISSDQSPSGLYDKVPFPINYQYKSNLKFDSDTESNLDYINHSLTNLHLSPRQNKLRDHSGDYSTLPPHRDESRYYNYNRFKSDFENIDRFDLSDDAREKVQIMYQVSTISLLKKYF